MSRPGYLWLVQLDVGKRDRSWRGGVADDAIAAARGDIERAIGTDAPVSVDTPLAGSRLRLSTAPNAMIATLCAETGAPLVTWAIARRATAAPRLWEAMIEPRPSQAERPPWPWLAWRIESGAGDVAQEQLIWMVDYMRCAAWAWIERA